MTTASRTIPDADLPWGKRMRTPKDVPALVLLWALEEPDRIGEVALVHGASVLGRGGPQPEDRAARVVFARQRPGSTVERGALGGTRISRVQLRITPDSDGDLVIENVGKLPMLVRGAEVKKVTAEPGDVIILKNALVMMVTRRPPVLEEARGKPAADTRFGGADAFGIVGESPAIWRLRDAVAFAGQSPHHVLVHGASGVGKELAARAIHGASPRAHRPLVSRSAATFPPGLVDAELFGNAKSYPNAGMPERVGLVGEADGSTLFLDELGELPAEIQAHLLRVLDRGGEYQRLGESKVRHADLRLVAATNREIAELKHDLAARLTIRLVIPTLDERIEDVPLLVRHILARLGREMPEVKAKFFDGDEPRIDPALVEGLVLHRYTHHLRELERLVWLAVSSSKDEYLARTPAVEAELRIPTTEAAEASEADVRAALKAADGNVTRAARQLGLKNRFALYRIMRRYGIDDESSTP